MSKFNQKQSSKHERQPLFAASVLYSEPNYKASFVSEPCRPLAITLSLTSYLTTSIPARVSNSTSPFWQAALSQQIPDYSHPVSPLVHTDEFPPCTSSSPRCHPRDISLCTSDIHALTEPKSACTRRRDILRGRRGGMVNRGLADSRGGYPSRLRWGEGIISMILI